MKRVGYGVVMVAALLYGIEGLGFVSGINLSLAEMVFSGASAGAGVLMMMLGFGGIIIMLAHCRCPICRSAVGSMEKCDACELCKDKCAHHETVSCDGCIDCKEKCSARE